MVLSLNEEIQILINSGLTPTELFIVRLLFIAADGDLKPLSNYISNTTNGKNVLLEALEGLREKRIINSTFKIPETGQSLNIKNIPFNKNFIKMYVRESNEMGKELFDSYPPFITINGKMFSIRNFTRASLFSLEDFCLYYSKSIKASGYTHDRIMELLNYAKENNLIHYSILEFISSQKYKEIEYIRDSGEVNNYQNSELL